MGPHSILHAVKLSKKVSNNAPTLHEEEEEGSKPLSETLLDLQLNDEERKHITESGKSICFVNNVSVVCVFIEF